MLDTLSNYKDNLQIENIISGGAQGHCPECWEEGNTFDPRPDPVNTGVGSEGIIVNVARSYLKSGLFALY